MFADGVIKEVRRLKKVRMSKTARAVLGYREVDDLIRGRHDLDEAKELIKKHTRRYAKRQLTWFRKEKSALWIDLTTKKSEQEAVSLIVKKIGTDIYF